MTIVKLSDGRYAKFPDSMNKDQILEVLRNKFPVSKKNVKVSNHESNFLSSIKRNKDKSLLDLDPGLKDPRKLSQGTLGALGALGLALQPELIPMAEGAIPSLVNALARIGTNTVSSGLIGASQSGDKSMLDSALLTGEESIPLSVAFEARGPLFLGSKKLYDFINPSKLSVKFLNEIGGVNSDVNAERIANTINTSHDIQLADALKHKTKVIDSIGKKELLPENYLNNEKLNEILKKEPNIKRIHDKFNNEPNFENADKLQSQINTRIRELYDLSKIKKLDTEGGRILQELKGLKIDLDKDMDDFMDSQHPDLKREYKTFKYKYKKNVSPYYSNTKLTKISKGDTTGIRSSTIRNIFSSPNKFIEKILKDLPKETKDNILYNELHMLNMKNPYKLIKKLDELEQSKGYSKYITPEIRKIKEELKRKIIARNIALATGAGISGYAAGSMLNHPDIGGIAGIGAATLSPTAKEIIKVLASRMA